MAKAIATRERIVRRDWTRAKELRQQSRNKTPVKAISRALKRSPGALRRKARALSTAAPKSVELNQLQSNAEHRSSALQ
jgi:hypothetical protein